MNFDMRITTDATSDIDYTNTNVTIAGTYEVKFDRTQLGSGSVWLQAKYAANNDGLF